MYDFKTVKLLQNEDTNITKIDNNQVPTKKNQQMI